MRAVAGAACAGVALVGGLAAVSAACDALCALLARVPMGTALVALGAVAAALCALLARAALDVVAERGEAA